MRALLTEDAPARTGGAELQQMLLSRALADRGFEVDFIISSGDAPGMAYDYHGVRVVNGIPQSGGGGPFELAHTWARLTRNMRRLNADVFYQRSAGRVTGMAGLYCALTGTPFVYAAASDMDLDGSYE